MPHHRRMHAQQDSALSLCLKLGYATCRSLALKDCQKLSDANFRTALSHLTSVVHLDLTSCVPLSDDTLREVCASAGCVPSTR